MPLERGGSRKVVRHNIAELTEANKSKPPEKRRGRKQIIAIALSNARESMKKGK